MYENLCADELRRLWIHNSPSISAPKTPPMPSVRHSADKPFLFADWHQILFLHFLISPEALGRYIAPPFELELYDGHACMSVVAVTMRNFRPVGFDPIALPFRFIREQRFLNLRTYVRCHGERGAFFLHGWLSRPTALPLPAHFMALPFAFAKSRYQHVPQNDTIAGTVSTAQHGFAYRATMIDQPLRAVEPGSLAEFTMEHYNGYFSRRGKSYVFRAWHPAWLQQPVDATIRRDDLILSQFPEWKHAKLAEACLAPGFPRVALGKAHRIPATTPKHRVLSRLFEMP